MTGKSAIGLRGSVRVPGDKSISHRYALLAGAGAGGCRIQNYSSSEDCGSTLRCLQELGVRIVHQDSTVCIEGPGLDGWQAPRLPLDAGNSGTALRLLAGLVASQPFKTTLTGDASLRSRPMRRICEPLQRMGAHIESHGDFRPPLTISGAELVGISYHLPMASAQVKSCLLLAGLRAQGVTRVQEPATSRDHTEVALPVFGVPVRRQNGWIEVRAGRLQNPPSVEVPGDFSAATFFMMGALMAPGSHLQLHGVGTNPTRTALLKLLLDAGAQISLENERSLQNESTHDLEIRFSPELLAGFPAHLEGKLIPNLIDEFPALAILGTQLERGLTVHDAAELRTKECDRIRAIVENLRCLGVAAEEFSDGFYVPHTPLLKSGSVQTYGDHRIAMAFALAGLVADGPVKLDDPSCVSVSFPDFFSELRGVGFDAQS